MEDLFLSLVQNLFYLLGTIAVGFIIALLKEKYGVEALQRVQKELETKQELAYLAVKFVEQAYKDLDGKEKYTQAAVWLSNRIEEIGLEITEDEIKGLIESTLRHIKDELGEEWAEVIK